MAKQTKSSPVSLRNQSSLSRQVVCACGHVAWYGGALPEMGGKRCDLCDGRFVFKNGALHVEQLVPVPVAEPKVEQPAIGDEALAEYADEPVEPQPTGRVVLIRRRRIDPEDVA